MKCGALSGQNRILDGYGMRLITTRERCWHTCLAGVRTRLCCVGGPTFAGLTLFLKLKALLEPFGITRYYTDGWGAYERHIEVEKHTVGKDNTQKIESKHIRLRTRIKRLVRRTICFSKTERMHDLVIGLFINRYEFGRAI